MNRLRATVTASSPSAMRMFSTAQHVPPKKLHGTTGRYAGAVYTAASKVGSPLSMPVRYSLEIYPSHALLLGRFARQS